jgi:hypothetical protein
VINKVNQSQRLWIIFASIALLIAIAIYFSIPAEQPKTLEVNPKPVTEPTVSPVPVQTVSATPVAPKEKKKLHPEELKKLRSEMKSSLAAAYTALAAGRADFNRYSTDIKYLGMSVGPNMKFKWGFLHPFDPDEKVSDQYDDEDPMRMTSDDLVREYDGSYTPEAHAIDLAQFASYCKKGCTASEKGFEVIIVTPIPGGS